MNQFNVGDLVVYKMKNEIGLVGQVIDEHNVRCWWHMGGTRATIDIGLIEHISIEMALKKQFSNQYALNSILNRRTELFRQINEKYQLDLTMDPYNPILYDDKNPLFDYMD